MVSSPLESLWLIGKLLPRVKIKMLSTECIEALAVSAVSVSVAEV